MLKQKLRIGTRHSQLAIWQAQQVQSLIAKKQVSSELILIKSEGDRNLTTPIYDMGVEGVFTRSLDQALLNHEIDIAVHSMKDVPVNLAKGVIQSAVLEREAFTDVLVYNLSLIHI